MNLEKTQSIVALKLGKVKYQKPYQQLAGVVSAIMVFHYGSQIYKLGIGGLDYTVAWQVLLIFVVLSLLCIFFIQGYRVILTEKFVSLYLLYPFRLTGKFAPLDEITRLENGWVTWNRPMHAITVFWRGRRGREDKLYISLDNFPTGEVQRLLDELGKRRPDLKIPAVGEQAREIDGSGQ